MNAPANYLERISSGRIMQPPTVVIYGPEGVGKTRFAAGSKKPIFIDPELSSTFVDVKRFKPNDWPDLLGFLDYIETGDHDHGTLVVDTLDWVEHMLHEAISKRHGKPINDIGFNTGYQIAQDEWRAFLGRMERIRSARNMGIVLIAHSSVVKHKNPFGDDYARFEMKLWRTNVGLFKEWPEYLFYAAWETYAVEKEKDKRQVVGVSGGAHLYTTHNAAFDAKARLPIPEQLPVNWGAFAGAVSEAFKKGESK